ncbi:histidine phosphotransferase family protein [Magnetovibrio sp.]|uniref:histidine phosphotransferase family protein n=1 Tax=Magnetovibrio sp. TaxID=2024836 RepID=UPI002F9305D9
MNIDHKVAQLLVSRVCHDLAGGVSALSTGAELLSEDKQMADGAALDVIAMSAAQCASRLAFFRVAFGLGGGESDTITTDDLKKLLVDYLQGGRIAVNWTAENARIGLMSGKLLLGLCLIGAEALPRGGDLRIDVSEIGGRLGFAVFAQGTGAVLRPELKTALSVDVAPDLLTARTVHGHFTVILAQSLDAEMEILADVPDEIRLAALL